MWVNTLRVQFNDDAVKPDRMEEHFTVDLGSILSSAL